MFKVGDIIQRRNVEGYQFKIKIMLSEHYADLELVKTIDSISYPDRIFPMQLLISYELVMSAIPKLKGHPLTNIFKNIS